MRFLALVLMFVFTSELAASTEKSVTTIQLTPDNSVSLVGPVSKDSVMWVVAQAVSLDATMRKGETMYLVLDTPGGSVIAGLNLIEVLTGLGRDIQTITIMSASMGFHIANNLGRRLILSTGIMMSHLASGSFAGSINGSSKVRPGFWERLTTSMDKVVVSRTNGKYTLEEYQSLITNEYWSFGQEAIEQGFADEVVRIKCSKEMFTTVVNNKILCPLLKTGGSVLGSSDIGDVGL